MLKYDTHQGPTWVSHQWLLHGQYVHAWAIGRCTNHSPSAKIEGVVKVKLPCGDP